MDLKEAELLGQGVDRHWYYRAKLAALLHLIRHISPSCLLDVGAGDGFFSRALLEKAGILAATCVDPGYETEGEEELAGKRLLFRRSIVQSDADLVLMMDVLEHVDDDAALVRDYAGRVTPGTHFVVTVPAFQWLWSGHDVFLEHRRRYTLTGIEAVLRSAGLRVERGCYFYGALFPAAAASRLLGRLWHRRDAAPQSQMRPFGPVLNSALFAACRLELPVFQANRLLGLTAFVHAVKARND